jgi:3-hydroxy-9,10-secoandrosta-1,3,5(10)-triene-9,17-dione monooxygenase
MIAAGIAYVQGRGRRVDGGLVISGTWNFCSGVVGGGWNMLACVVKDGDKAVDWAQCLLRAGEYEILDDWQTLGMRGTSSCSVKVDELFVPEHRVQSMAIALQGHQFKGGNLNTNPMFHMPTTAYGGHTPAAAIVGAAQGGVDLMVDWVKSRSTAYTGAKMRED